MITEQERKDCLLAATSLNAISKMVFCLLCTLPFFGYCFLIEPQHYYNLLFSALGILSGIVVGSSAWHLYFDAQLFKNIAINNLPLEKVDNALFLIFNKEEAAQKDVAKRIEGSYKLAKSFWIKLVVHIVFVILLMVSLLYGKDVQGLIFFG